MSTVTVIMYHHIAPHLDEHTVSPEHFREQMEWLREQQIKILSAEEFEAWCDGKLHLTRPAALLTFDDGWLDNWVYALPTLKAYDAPAIFFVVTSWPGEGPCRHDLTTTNWQPPSHYEVMKRVESSDSLTRDSVVMRWSELLAARGTELVALQSHSHSHGDWWSAPMQWAQRVESIEMDLHRSRDVLEARTGQVPSQLCWPKGRFTPALVKRAQKIGFEVQFSTLRGHNAGGRKQLVRRINAENRGASWLARCFGIYQHPLSGKAVGFAHKWVFRHRVQRALGSCIPKEEMAVISWARV